MAGSGPPIQFVLLAFRQGDGYRAEGGAADSSPGWRRTGALSYRECGALGLRFFMRIGISRVPHECALLSWGFTLDCGACPYCFKPC